MLSRHMLGVWGSTQPSADVGWMYVQISVVGESRKGRLMRRLDVATESFA